MKRQTFEILFYIKRTKVLKNGEVPVFGRITFRGKRCEFSTHRSINPNYWDSNKQMVNSKCKELQELKDYLKHIEYKIYDCKKELEYDNKEVTAVALRNRYEGISDDEEKYIIKVFKDHNERCEKLVGRDFAKDTVERYATCCNHLQNFIRKNYNREDILLREIDYKFITDFEFYLKTDKVSKKNRRISRCCHNTTVKYLKNFKKIVLYALANGWIYKNPFGNTRYHLDEVDIPYLEENELEILMNKEFDIERLQRVKDIFVFCCFTGLAYSDVKKFNKSHLIERNGDNTWIVKKREKTGIVCKIPLLQPAHKILEKYKHHPFCEESGFLLPVPTNQKMNAYLKEIADLCGIKKDLVSHCGRHTFATTVSLANNISMEVVSKMLGHTSIEMTRRYARIIDSMIEKSMNTLKLKYAS